MGERPFIGAARQRQIDALRPSWSGHGGQTSNSGLAKQTTACQRAAKKICLAHLIPPGRPRDKVRGFAHVEPSERTLTRFPGGQKSENFLEIPANAAGYSAE
jgi:hypothetical protein